MKKFFLVLLTLAAPLASHAIVADSFECSVSLKDTLTGDEVVQRSTPQAIRIPLADSVYPNVHFTKARTSLFANLKNKHHTISVNFTYEYTHAVKVDSLGSFSDAKQSNCEFIDLQVCSSSSKGCTGLNQVCIPYPNPYEQTPIPYWSSVRIVNGTPEFNEKSLLPTVLHLNDENHNPVGLAIIECRYKGTYE
jgi:hypothetical protein